MIKHLVGGVECWLLESMYTSNNLYYAYAGVRLWVTKTTFRGTINNYVLKIYKKGETRFKQTKINIPNLGHGLIKKTES